MRRIQAKSRGVFSKGHGRRWLTSLAAALLLVSVTPLAAKEAGELKLVVRVFRIPQVQQFESDWPDGKGGTLKLQVHGNVISAFPRATVFFPTERTNIVIGTPSGPVRIILRS